MSYANTDLSLTNNVVIRKKLVGFVFLSRVFIVALFDNHENNELSNVSHLRLCRSNLHLIKKTNKTSENVMLFIRKKHKFCILLFII